MQPTTKAHLEPIAVIGLAFRLPDDAVSSESFWRMMMEKRCCSRKIPEDRMSIDTFYHPDPARVDAVSVSSAHFIEGDLARFDAPFFNITTTEAAALDPQHRIAYETAYQALENAGLAMEKIAGSKTSVYAGTAYRDYGIISQKDFLRFSRYSIMGVDASMLANRISHFFDFRGPSASVETACSSSLVALDLSCQSLWNGSCDMGLVVSTNLILSPDCLAGLSNLGLLGPDGRCYSFDERANGYARGEGSVVVVTKRLTDAVRDGDTIRAVIRSTGANSDGYTPTLTQPNMAAHERLIKETYAKAGLDLSTTRFVESHGTGTAVGDPIEASALGAVFGRYRSPTDPLFVGAVKSNIGHLEPTSGLAGLVKTILVLEKGIIPPNTNIQCLNPKIDAEYFNIVMPEKAIPWPSGGLRRASINSFGVGGSNCHVVIEDAYNFLRLNNLAGNHFTVDKPPLQCDLDKQWPATEPPCSLRNGDDATTEPDINNVAKDSDKNGNTGVTDDKPSNEILPRLKPRLLVLSSADKEGVLRLAGSYASYFRQLPSKHENQSFLDDLVYTLGARRSLLLWRSYAVVDSIQNIDLQGLVQKPFLSTKNPSLGFVFSGQGAQWYGMGRELLSYPIFEESLQCASIYLRELGCSWSLIDELLKSKHDSRVNEPELSQALCTAIQIALVDLLTSFGIFPSAVVGHSSGEIGAAYAAGFISRRSSWRLAYYRGALTSRLTSSTHDEPSQTMMSVGLPELELWPYFEKVANEFGILHLVAACMNSPQNTTVSGFEDQIDFLKSMMDQEGIFARKLAIPVAYHSPQMETIAADYLEVIQQLEPGVKGPSMPAMVSSVTGNRIYADDVIISQYWADNMVSPVNFHGALSRLCARPPQIPKKLDGSHRKIIDITQIIEIGPHSALQGPIRDILTPIRRKNEISYTSVLKRNVPAVQSMLEAMGHLHCSGYGVDLASVNEYGNSKVRSQRKVLHDLPVYAFNHSQRYWHESRLGGSGFRFRKHGRHDLLGTPIPDWNPLEPVWRNVINVSEMPWVEDHKIHGRNIYPGAGILVMAVEAAKQVADPDRKVVGYNFKDVVFDAELEIPSGPDGIETKFHLRVRKDSSSKDAGWFEFRLYSGDENKWMENSHGCIQLDYSEGGSTAIGGDNEQREKFAHYAQMYQAGRSACNYSVNDDFWYNHYFGLTFGPSFRRLTKATYNGEGQAICDVSLYQWRNDTRSPYAQPHVIHPASLDGIIQSTIPALSLGGTRPLATVLLPTRIHKMWVSNFGLNFPEAENLSVYVKSNLVGYRGSLSSLSVMDDEGKQLRLFMEGFESTSVGMSVASRLDLMNVEVDLCFSLERKPDVEVLDRSQLSNYCGSGLTTNDMRIDFFDDINLLIRGFITLALEEIGGEQLQNIPPHFQKYIEWMKCQVSQANLDQENLQRNEHIRDVKHLNMLADKLEKESAYGNLIVKLGQNLVKIFKGEIEPWTLIYEDGQVKYEDGSDKSMRSTIPALSKYISTLAHKMPGMKILHVGTGDGIISKEILQTLSTDTNGNPSTPRYSLYRYTSISEDALHKAQEVLSHHINVEFKQFDVEKDPEVQGLEPPYDIIISSSVNHASKPLNVSLKNIRKLLKPNGKLAIVNDDYNRRTFVFGLLPDWEYRSPTSLIPEIKWDDVLVEAGFSRIDICVPDNYEKFPQGPRLIISTAMTDNRKNVDVSGIVIVGNADSAVQCDIAQHLKPRLIETSATAHGIMSLQEASSAKYENAIYIFINEVDQPLLSNLDNDSYLSLHSILSSANAVLWTTGNSEKQPGFGMVLGLGRTLTNENAKLKFTTLSLEQPGMDISKDAEHILQVKSTMAQEDQYEQEYVERDGVLQISRLFEVPRLNSDVRSRIVPLERKVQPFGSGPPLKLSIEDLGLLDTLYFCEDAGYYRPLGLGEVEIEVRTVGVNFMDCLTLLGRVNQKVIGAECAGIVSRVGQGTPFKPGDRVVACALDTFKTYVRAPWMVVMKIPSTLSFAQAASIPSNFTTAWHSLVEVGRIRKGDAILIHSGSGGTGQAAIQIAQYFGAKVFATVGNAGKKRFLMDHYGIPEEQILYSRDASFAPAIKRLTNGLGVDIVLNSLSGELLVASWECIGPFGRFLEIGKKDIWSQNKLPMFPFARNVSFSGIDLASMATGEGVLLVQKSFKAVMELMEEGKLRPAEPLQVYKISEVETALRTMQSGKNIGKMVVEIDKNDSVLTILDTKPTYAFREDASYVISGGLGGLGRSITRWMVERGARNLILLSRFGVRTDQAKLLVEELGEKGVVVATPACDIAEESVLRDVLDGCMKTMPHIKGCIQASMALEDAIFENMNFENWSRSIRPKVHGSWNLHNLLPDDLDFFIMLSSIAGVYGSPGQSNYAAGNTYQDLLARHRVAKGQKAVSIDLGLMVDAGVVKDNKDLRDRIGTNHIFKPVTEEELLALLDRFCDPECELLPELRGQVVTGLGLSKKAIENDLDAYFTENPLFSHLKHMRTMRRGRDKMTSSKEGVDYLRQFTNASSLPEAGAVVANALAAKLSRVLAIAIEDLDLNKPIDELGVDSLVAVELRNWFAREWGTEVAVFDIVGGASIAGMGDMIANRSPHRRLLNNQ
ncbi:Type I Iterative PKS [Emmonsiellopsis sp. PD_5]|nr:Type I Iterative PKS [Emmonsiellopsis sp. PD_5]